MQTRITVSISSDYDAALVTKWAEATGRPLGNLACYLLERGLAEARKDGIVPAEVIASVNGQFFSDL